MNLRRQVAATNENLKVIVRCRPPLPREIQDELFISTVEVSSDNRVIQIYQYKNIQGIPSEEIAEYLDNPNNYAVHKFTFDHVYGQESSQEDIYNNTARNSVLSTLDGFNASIIAYGQTGTGKTYTMEGFSFKFHHPNIGIIPRSVDEIFNYIQNCQETQSTFMVRASYLQIYNEQISDLLKTDRQSLSIREDLKKGVYVEGLSEWAVRSPRDIYALIKRGAVSRATASTKLNDVSSRSHAVFIITVEQMYVDQENKPKKLKVGKLNLVDLAGSERVGISGAKGQRLEECKHINLSLSALGNVISQLTQQMGVRGHIPYRDSKITRLLEDSLGGNCKTTMVATISPAHEAFGESLSTLQFANRAKKIKNSPVVNEDLDQNALLRRYEAELFKLRNELQQKSQNIVDQQKIQKLEEDKKKFFKAYQDEIEAKKGLEEQIKALQSQVLIGGQRMAENEKLKNLLEQQQQQIRFEYEQKMNDLERERQQIIQEKHDCETYKGLLLKQRDIMINLSTKLNERDESIRQYNEELEAYEIFNKELENNIGKLQGKVNQMTTILQQNNIPFFDESETKNNYSQVTYGDQVAYNVVNGQQDRQQEKLIELQQTIENQKKEIEQLKRGRVYNDSMSQGKRLNDQSYLQQQQLQQQQFAPQLNAHQHFEKSNEMKSRIDRIVDQLTNRNPSSSFDPAQELILLQKQIGEHQSLLKKATGSILKPVGTGLPNSIENQTPTSLIPNQQRNMSATSQQSAFEKANGKKVYFRQDQENEKQQSSIGNGSPSIQPQSDPTANLPVQSLFYSNLTNEQINDGLQEIQRKQQSGYENNATVLSSTANNFQQKPQQNTLPHFVNSFADKHFHQNSATQQSQSRTNGYFQKR